MARSLTRALVALCATAVLGTMVVLPGPARAEPAPDPGPGTIALPPMTSARAGATLTQLADGGLLTVGAPSLTPRTPGQGLSVTWSATAWTPMGGPATDRR